MIALNEQNIMLNSIELSITGEPHVSHLSRVSSATYGIYTTLTALGEAPAAIRNVLSYVRKTLVDDYSDAQKNRRTVSA
jgi:hypothetical protein